MSSDERERYKELDKVTSQYAMDLGEVHSAIKRVLRTWAELDVVGVESMSSEPGREYINAERMQEVLSELERVYERQHERLDADEATGHGFVKDSSTGRCSVCDHIKEWHEG